MELYIFCFDFVVVDEGFEVIVFEEVKDVCVEGYFGFVRIYVDEGDCLFFEKDIWLYCIIEFIDSWKVIGEVW